MKIVAFEGQGGPRIGIVEGDQVIDLQAADPKVPNDLGEYLAKTNGDTKQLAEIAKRAPANARKPLSSITYALPVGRPGKIICLGCGPWGPPPRRSSGRRFPKRSTMKPSSFLWSASAPSISPRAMRLPAS